jgi:hypothetical protein
MYIMHGKEAIIYDDYGYIQMHTNVQSTEWEKRFVAWIMDWLDW